MSIYRFRIPKPTDNEVSFISMFAVSTGTISTHLQQIPNQPLVFKVINSIVSNKDCFKIQIRSN